MDLLHILTGLYFVRAVCAGTHSLWYLFTLTSSPSPFPELVIVAMVDDIQLGYYDSIERIITSRQHWHKEENDTVYAKLKRMSVADTQYSLKSRLQYMKEHMNDSGTQHTYQRIAGCELDDDGSARFQAKDAYNGKDEFVYNEHNCTWNSPFPELQRASQESCLIRNVKIYYSYCVSDLKSYLREGRNIINRRVSPRIRKLQKQVGSAGGVEITCLATGFYPRHIELTLQRDKQPVLEQELIRGDILPNCDGTYQQRISLSVSAEELREGHTYTCSVRHVSMDNKLDVTWDLQPKTSTGEISIAVVTLLSIVFLIIGFCFWRKRKINRQEYSRSGKTEEERERINRAQGAAKDAEGEELERQGE